VSNILGNKVAPSKIPTEANRKNEEPREPDRSILIPLTPMDEIDGESHQLSAESLITVIELAVICLQESDLPRIEQMRAKRLLKGALNLHPEGFVMLKTDRSTPNVDWETLLSIYIEIKRSSLEPPQIIPSLLRRNFDDWFDRLDNFYKYLLLDLLIL
jgi:hypothetical protein